MARGDRSNGPGSQHPAQQTTARGARQQQQLGQGAAQGDTGKRDKKTEQREAKREHNSKGMSARASQQRAKGAKASQRDRTALPTLNEAQTEAVKALLAQIPTLAANLRGMVGKPREEIVAQLAGVTAAEEAVAQVFAARLGEARGPVAPDAIEIAQAVGSLDQRHAVGREARRSMNRLRSTGAKPQLTIPLPAPQTVSLAGTPSVASGARTIHIHPHGYAHTHDHEHDGEENEDEDEDHDHDVDDEADEDGGLDDEMLQEDIADDAGPEIIFARDARQHRLIEAYASRTRESGGLSLAMAWQEGADPDLVRGYILDLDFWQNGVQSCVITRAMTTGAFQRDVVEKMRTEDKIAPVKVNWAQARRFILDALDVNAWRKTEPAVEFTRRRSLFEARLLEEPADDERRAAIADERERLQREGDRIFVTPNLEADEMLANWLGAWSFGDYGLAYDLLAADNPMRRKETRADYIAVRRQWADEAKPASLRLTLIREQERRASALWTPTAAGGPNLSGRKEMEAFWSLIVNDSPIGGQLDELPMGTLISKETSRHWYWTAYTMQRDRATADWLIVSQRDEGAASQGLTVEELQKRITEARETAEKLASATPEANPANNRTMVEAVRNVTGALTTALHYEDALIARLPLDEAAYKAAVQDARTLNSHERAAALLERMQGRFADDAQTRFELGIEQYLTAEQYSQQGQPEAHNAWLNRAIATMTQVATDDPTAQHLQGLAELLSHQGHFSQAETRLREAIAVDPNNATLYIDLAEALMGRAGSENLDEALPLSDDERKDVARQALNALRDASKIDKNIPRLFTRMGAIYQALDQYDDAIISYEEAIRRDPADDAAHYMLGSLYLSRGKPQEAAPLLEKAVQLQSSAIPYRLNLAACYANLGRTQEASRQLDEIDRMQPGLPQVAELRAALAQQKKKK